MKIFQLLNEDESAAVIQDNGSISTLMGHIPTYDSEGRPLSANPNYVATSYTNRTTGKRYTMISKGWIVRWFEGDVPYMQFNSGKHFKELDRTPDYVKNRIDT